MCQCPLCLERISRPSVSHADAQFQKDLAEGAVEHIDCTTEGKPIYVWTGYAGTCFRG